jgi:hypothetical protein
MTIDGKKNRSHEIQEGREVGKVQLHLREEQTGSCFMVQIPGNNAANKRNVVHTTYSSQSFNCNSSDSRYSTSILVDAAVPFFNLKISPVITYGIQLIWQDLTEQNLKKLESIKTMFL